MRRVYNLKLNVILFSSKFTADCVFYYLAMHIVKTAPSTLSFHVKGFDKKNRRKLKAVIQKVFVHLR